MTLENDMNIKITNSLQSLFANVIDERQNYYNNNAPASKNSVDELISSYANEIGVTAAGINLIPGPAGMLATVPEIILMIKKQLRMIYDIGRAYGKDKNVLTQEMLIGIMFSSTGTLGAGMIIMAGNKVILKRASIKVIQKIIIQLGGRLTQKAISSMVCKWLPLVGAAAMGLWARSSTKSIGLNAKEIFSKEIVVENYDEKKELPLINCVQDNSFNCSQESTIDYEKVKILISMLKAARVLNKDKKDFIIAFIKENPDLKDNEKDSLICMYNNQKTNDINYKVFEDNPEEAVSLILDLISLATIDKNITLQETMFIKNVAKRLYIEVKEVEQLIYEAQKCETVV